MSQEMFDDVNLELSYEPDGVVERRVARSRAKTARDFFRRASEKWLNALANDGDDDEDDEGESDAATGPGGRRRCRSRRNTVGSSGMGGSVGAPYSRRETPASRKSSHSSMCKATVPDPISETPATVTEPEMIVEHRPTVYIRPLTNSDRPAVPPRKNGTVSAQPPVMSAILSHNQGLRSGHLSAAYQVSTASDQSDADGKDVRKGYGVDPPSYSIYPHSKIAGKRFTVDTKIARPTHSLISAREPSTCYFDDVFDVESLHSSSDDAAMALAADAAAHVPSFGALVTISSFDESDVASTNESPRSPSPWRRAAANGHRDFGRPLSIDTCGDYRPPADSLTASQITPGGLVRSSSARSVATTVSCCDVRSIETAPPPRLESLVLDSVDIADLPAICSERCSPGVHAGSTIAGAKTGQKGHEASGWPFGGSLFKPSSRPSFAAIVALFLAVLFILLGFVLLYDIYVMAPMYGSAAARRAPFARRAPPRESVEEIYA